ncbi:unnamed protein product [Musa acuminata var. zebrina]
MQHPPLSDEEDNCTFRYILLLFQMKRITMLLARKSIVAGFGSSLHSMEDHYG